MRLVVLLVTFGLVASAAAYFANDPGFAFGIVAGTLFGAAVVSK